MTTAGYHLAACVTAADGLRHRGAAQDGGEAQRVAIREEVSRGVLNHGLCVGAARIQPCADGEQLDPVDPPARKQGARLLSGVEIATGGGNDGNTRAVAARQLPKVL